MLLRKEHAKKFCSTFYRCTGSAQHSKKNRNTEKHRNKATNLYNKILDTLINLCMTVGQNSF